MNLKHIPSNNDYYLDISSLSMYKLNVFIIDLGPESIRLREVLLAYFIKTCDGNVNARGLAIAVLRSIIDDLISFLNMPPLEALERVIELRDFSYPLETLGSVVIPKTHRRVSVQQMTSSTISEIDVLDEVIKPYVLPLYLKIRQQTHHVFASKGNVGTRLSAVDIGVDHAVIQQSSPVLSGNPQKVETEEDMIARLEESYYAGR